MTDLQADLRPVIRKLVARFDISETEMANTLDAILQGRVAESAIAAFLVSLSMKGETPTEIRAILQSVRAHSTRITPRISGSLVDTCGTGGDSIRTFNVSTAAAVIVAASGATVAKHGNRSVSGLCGSADFLEYIGLDLSASPQKVQKCIEDVGIGFLFAPAFHPAMKNVASVRKAIGVRTIFNLVGPLSNPCTNITGQVIGVFKPSLMETLAEVVAGYIKEAMIVHASDGFDELSNTCENDIIWIADGKTKRLRLNPKVLDIKIARAEQLVVNSRYESIKSTLEVIYGLAPREKEDMAVMNAAAALVVGRIVEDLKDGVTMARQTIKRGDAKERLAQLIKSCGNPEKLAETEKKFL
jgi:anthranilate phosphoribosyltransferase